MSEHDLIATNTQFQKRKRRLWTFQNRGTGRRYQLDYIIVRQKWRNSVHNSQAFNSFKSVGSDHRVVIAKIKLSLRTSKSKRSVKYDWDAFQADHHIQMRYTVEVRNRFQGLVNEEDITEKYERFIKANQKAMETHVPEKQKIRRSNRSIHPNVIQARGHLSKANENLNKNWNNENLEELNKAKQNLYNAYDEIREQELTEMTQRIEQTHRDSKYREAWSVINEMTGRKKSKEGQISGANAEERILEWFNHFDNLLGKAPIVEDENENIPLVLENLEINDGPFTNNELQAAKKKLKNRKSPGPDGIPPEVIKCCNLDDVILYFCNKALIDGLRPSQWSLSNIQPVPKTGDLSLTDNYRGISLTCIISKLLNRMILNRIKEKLDHVLRFNQNGFRKSCSTLYQILAIRRIIEESKKNNLSAVLCFIDFRKAFDSINRDKMIKILRAYGIPTNLLNAIENMYTNTRARVISQDGVTDEFEIKAGVLQGDTLAPYLFVIVLDHALRTAIDKYSEDLGFTITPRRSSRYPAETISDLDFADDICLLSDTIEKAQKLLKRVETACRKVGLHLNAKKTEVVPINVPLPYIPLKTIERQELKSVDDFKYLGSWVKSSEQDVKVRKALAWKALNKKKSVWKSNLTRRVKIVEISHS